MSETKILLPVGGALTGVSAYTTMGGIGLVGAFGGISLGLGAMTGIGAVTGTALYGGIYALQTGDRQSYVATGLGSLAGVGFYNTIGGVGLGIGGTAFGLGMGTMALSGGVLGLGIYGLTKMFNPSNVVNNYYENSFFINKITEEYLEKKVWGSLEVDNELNNLKEKLKDKIDYQALINNRKANALNHQLEQKRNVLMAKLKQTYSSFQKLNLLKEIDKIEQEIKQLKTKYKIIL